MKKLMQELKTDKKVQRLSILLAVAILGVCILVFVITQLTKPKEDTTEIITVSTLEKIINVSELSTFTSVYNGIAEVKNKENPENIDYYVSYESKVKAGIDFEAVNITVDNDEKTIKISVPEVYITETNVDIASLDFIFLNEKANTATVSEEAFKACKADVENESKQKVAITELAKENAVNILTALIKPIIQQLDAEL